MFFRRSSALAKQAGPGPEDPVTAEREIARIVASTLAEIASELPEAVLSTLDPSQISAAVDWAEVGEKLMPVAGPLEQVIAQEARSELPAGALAKATVTDAEAGFPIELALINELAVIYAEQHAGRLVIEISTKMRETIQTVISSNVSGLLPRDAVVRLLRMVIPLHSAWAEAVAKAELRAYEAAMQGGASVTTATKQAERVAANRAARLLLSRAENIARTEAMTAMNEGKLASWHQQVASGWMDVDSLKEWEEGRDPCEICAPYVGEIVRWDQPFSNGKQMPPLHPRCRCTAIALPPDDDLILRMLTQQAEAGPLGV